MTRIVIGTPLMGRRGGGSQSGSTGTRQAGGTGTWQATSRTRIKEIFHLVVDLFQISAISLKSMCLF